MLVSTQGNVEAGWFGYGTEAWTNTIVKKACTETSGSSGGGGISAFFRSIGIEGWGGSESSYTYAHYEGRVKSCDGWRNRCSGSGTEEITNFTPIQPCRE